MSTIHGVKCIHFYLCCFLQQFSQQRVVGFCGRLARGQQILSLQRAGLHFTINERTPVQKND